MSKKIVIKFVLLLMGAGLMAGMPTASATSCTLATYPFITNFGCIMPANSRNHFLHVSVAPFVSAAIQDVATQVYVFTEDAGIFGIERTITGLYGQAYSLSGRAPFPPSPFAPIVTLSND